MLCDQFLQLIDLSPVHPLVAQQIRDQQFRRVVKEPREQMVNSPSARLLPVDNGLVNEGSPLFVMAQVTFIVSTVLYARGGSRFKASTTSPTVALPFSQSTFIRRSSPSVNCGDFLRGIQLDLLMN
jgi:hypothetical protein